MTREKAQSKVNPNPPLLKETTITKPDQNGSQQCYGTTTCP